MGESQPQHTNIASELALLLVLATLWGASYTFLKIAVATIPPVTLIAGRTLIAGLLLVAIMHWRGDQHCRRMPRTGGASCFRPASTASSRGPWWPGARGRSMPGVATILNSTAPIFTFFLTLADHPP